MHVRCACARARARARAVRGPRHHYPRLACVQAAEAPRPSKTSAATPVRRPSVSRLAAVTPSSLARMVHHSSSANAHFVAPARLLRAIEAARRCGVPSEWVAHGAALLHKLQPMIRRVMLGHPMPQPQPYPEPPFAAAPSPRRAVVVTAAARCGQVRARRAVGGGAGGAGAQPARRPAHRRRRRDARALLGCAGRPRGAARRARLHAAAPRHASVPRWSARPRTPALGRAGRGGAALRRRDREPIPPRGSRVVAPLALPVGGAQCRSHLATCLACRLHPHPHTHHRPWHEPTIAGASRCTSAA